MSNHRFTVRLDKSYDEERDGAVMVLSRRDGYNSTDPVCRSS